MSLGGGMSLHINLAGDKEVQKAMRTLPRKIHKKVLRAAIRSGMAPALKESKRMIPVESGALRDSMKISIKAFPPHVMVGKLWPDKNMAVGFWPEGSNKPELRKPIKYAHLVEGGHVLVRNGQVIGEVAPQPFIRDAFAQTKDEQIRRFRKSYLRGSKREWRKLVETIPKKRKLA